MPLQPIYHCGVGQILADLKAVSDQMFIDAGGYSGVVDKNVVVYVHGTITDTTGGGLFGYPQWLPGGAYNLSVEGFTGKNTDTIICTTSSTSIQASNFTFKNIKFTGGVRVPWFIGGENKGHDNCIFDNAYQAHYEVISGFMRNNTIYNVNYGVLTGYSNDPSKPMLIENNVVFGNPGDYSCFAQLNAIVRNNIIFGSLHGISCQSAIGNAKIYNNLLMNCGGSGIHFFASSSIIQGYEVYNNTFYNNNFGIQANYTQNEGNIIKNNLFIILSGQQGFQFDSNNRNQTLDYNFYEVQAGGILGAVHNGSIWQTFTTLALLRAVYPQYEVNGKEGSAELVLPGGSGATDYKIKATSGAKNVGLNLSAVLTTDYFGKSRPKGIAFDCGFHEEATIGLTGSLNKYSFTIGEYVIASATIVGTATGVFISINGKTYPLVNLGSGSWQATIKSADIGTCAAAAVVLTAYNDDYIGTLALSAITILARVVGNYDIEAIAQGISALMIQIPEIKTALSYEPRTIDRLPATTIFFDGFSQSQTEAQSFTIHYRYNLRVYVKLHDDQESQQQLNSLVGKILEVLKANKSFLDCVLFGQAASGITAAILDKNNPVLLAEINIDAMKEED